MSNVIVGVGYSTSRYEQAALPSARAWPVVFLASSRIGPEPLLATSHLPLLVDVGHAAYNIALKTSNLSGAVRRASTPAT